MSIIISVEREGVRDTPLGMKEMKEIKAMPIEFMENGIQAKLDEIYDYRICFYDELNSDIMKDSFELYTKDLRDDGYKLIKEGIKKFYPNDCDNAYMEKVKTWYKSVEELLLDLRFELMKKFNIANPYIELRKRKDTMKEGE